MMMTRCGSGEHKGLGSHSDESQKYTTPLVQIDLPGQRKNLPGNVLPILHEIAAMVAALESSGTDNSIDLKRSPLTSLECEALKEYLGRGDVSAEVNAHGPTKIHETSVSGVWWVAHFNQNNESLGQFIEVTMCPEILAAGDLHVSLRRFRERLEKESMTVNPNDVRMSLEALRDDEIVDTVN